MRFEHAFAASFGTSPISLALQNLGVENNKF